MFTPFDAEEERIREAYAKRQCGDLYSCFNAGHLFKMQGREKHLLTALRRHGWTRLEMKKILELGCGEGLCLREFIKWGARPENITGSDLIEDRLTVAGNLLPGKVTLQCGNAAHLDFPDQTFDLVLQSTMFTSILDFGLKQQIAAQMLRVLKPDGLILWYDYHTNNPGNPDVRGVKKPEIYRLFSGCRIELERITLAPPLCRALAPYSMILCCLLEKIPLLCTHYLGIIRKPK